MAYATYEDVQIRTGKTFSPSEQASCSSLLDRAALIIDSFAVSADKPEAIKKEVSVSMVSRVMINTDLDIPVGATQGSMSGLGYAQSWTMGSGGITGDLYLSKDDRRLLGIGNRIGSYSPVEEFACSED